MIIGKSRATGQAKSCSSVVELQMLKECLLVLVSDLIAVQYDLEALLHLIDKILHEVFCTNIRLRVEPRIFDSNEVVLDASF